MQRAINISMVISGGVLNAARKKENMKKTLNIKANSIYYPRQGKSK